MKAKDLTQADVGKWVTLRGKIKAVHSRSLSIQILGDITQSGDQSFSSLYPDTILEFTTPPPPVQEVGDVFYNGDGDMWTLRAIVGDACLLTGPDHDGHTDGIRGEQYPLPRTFTLLHKGQ